MSYLDQLAIVPNKPTLNVKSPGFLQYCLEIEYCHFLHLGVLKSIFYVVMIHPQTLTITHLIGQVPPVAARLGWDILEPIYNQRRHLLGVMVEQLFRIASYGALEVRLRLAAVRLTLQHYSVDNLRGSNQY